MDPTDRRRQVAAVLERNFLAGGGTPTEWQEMGDGIVAAHLAAVAAGTVRPIAGENPDADQDPVLRDAADLRRRFGRF